MILSNFASIKIGDFHALYGERAKVLAERLLPPVGIPFTTRGQALAVALDLYRYARTVDYDEMTLRDFTYWLYQWCKAHAAPCSVVSSVDFLLEHLDQVHEGHIEKSLGMLGNGSFSDPALATHAERVACWVVDTIDRT